MRRMQPTFLITAVAVPDPRVDDSMLSAFRTRGFDYIADPVSIEVTGTAHQWSALACWREFPEA